MNNTLLCPDMPGGFTLVPRPIIVQLTEITRFDLIQGNHIANANEDLDDLLGLKCAAALLDLMESATHKANTYNQSHPTATKPLQDFLSSQWNAVLQNRHFKKWYAERIAFHWLEGSSITELKSVGLVTSNNTDETYKNGFQHASERQRKRLALNAQNNAAKAMAKFITAFWLPNKSQYHCQPPCQKPSGFSIGMDVL